jgi:hypothetical protein
MRNHLQTREQKVERLQDKQDFVREPRCLVAGLDALAFGSLA